MRTSWRLCGSQFATTYKTSTRTTVISAQRVSMALWMKKRGTKSGCNLVGNFGFLFYKKSMLLVSYFFISILICSIKGLWKADRHPCKQVSTERHQDAVASVSNLLSRSPAQFGYHICSQAHGIRVLGYACQVTWPLFLCPYLFLTLMDISVREYKVCIQNMVFFHLDYFGLLFIIMKTVTDCKR